MAAPLRVALTLEQCWHRVPGGTASSILALAAELSRRDDVEVRGVAARHSALPPQPWTPPVPVTGLGLPRALLYETWHYLRWPPVQAATGPVDVVHATTLAIPPKRGPLVVTVHDLVFRENPQYVTRRGLRFFRRGLALAKSAADLVMVPSRATWAECVDAGFAEDRLRLVPHGVSVPEIPEAKVRDFLARYGLSRPYVLWCGTVEPRKNLPRLLEAFARARRRIPELELVLAGPAGWGAVHLDPAPGVRMVGFLPAADLHAAYAGARVFCYPSLREGFGLPVLEAMAHGVPVVTSAGSAMAEFADGAGLLVDPTDVDALADALVSAAGDRHDELSDAARRRAAQYSWTTAAERTVQVYREAAGR